MTHHIDQLEQFHLRDLGRLTPGSRVLFGHVPPLSTPPAWGDWKAHAEAHYATVTRVEYASFRDLHAAGSSGEWADEKKPVIFYESDGYSTHRHATDSGVLPYGGPGTYNGTNFTVLIDDLEAAGVELDLKPSGEYQARLADYNAQVVELPLEVSW